MRHRRKMAASASGRFRLHFCKDGRASRHVFHLWLQSMHIYRTYTQLVACYMLTDADTPADSCLVYIMSTELKINSWFFFSFCQVYVPGSAHTVTAEPFTLTLVTLPLLLLSPWQPRWPSRGRSWDGQTWTETERRPQTVCLCGGVWSFRKHSLNHCDRTARSVGQTGFVAVAQNAFFFILPVLTSTCVYLYLTPIG